jgi:hypothetical protein
MVKLNFRTGCSVVLWDKTDTVGLERSASSNDVAAHFFFQPKVDNDDLVISYLGFLKYPDFDAKIADMLLRLQGVKWIIRLGMYKHDMIFSNRSHNRKNRTGNLANQILGNNGAAGELSKITDDQI